MADVYLCLDLEPHEEFPIDAGAPGFAYPATVSEVMTNEALQGARWVRNWMAFRDRDVAMRYASERPTLVVIPIADAGTVPLGEIE